jgi:oxygen-independent coproporphyrinogen-3 oxidase
LVKIPGTETSQKIDKLTDVVQLNKELSLYFHFPFCKRKCYYCDFNSFSGLDHLMPDYIKALIAEIQFYLPQPSKIIKSVYFGGGTPSYFPVGALIEILKFVTTHFLVPGKAELTVEINPGTIDIEGLIHLQEAGFNRLSIGLQVIQNDLLRKIGRVHSAQEFFDIFELARETGFQNIGVDLIFGLPGQKMEQWQNTLHAVTELDPEHISAYCLQLEPGTPMYQQVAKQEIYLPKEEEVIEMMEFTMVYLQERGYEQYEISNYAKPGFSSVHNLGYWMGHDYLGFGAGATSTRLGQRWVNVNDPKVYIENLKKGLSVVDKRESIDKHIAAVEAVMLGLRLRTGINLRHFHDKYGIDLIAKTKENLEPLMEVNLIENNDGYLRLTYKGILTGNKITAKLVENL